LYGNINESGDVRQYPEKSSLFLGGAFSTHLDAVVGEKAKIFVSYDNPQNHLYTQRGLYEKGINTKFEMSVPAKQCISKNNAHSENIGV